MLRGKQKVSFSSFFNLKYTNLYNFTPDYARHFWMVCISPITAILLHLVSFGMDFPSSVVKVS